MHITAVTATPVYVPLRSPLRTALGTARRSSSSFTPTIEALLRRHPGEIAFAQSAQPRGPALNRLRACRLFEIFERDRLELTPMAVRVNDLMTQSIMNRPGLGFSA